MGINNLTVEEKKNGVIADYDDIAKEYADEFFEDTSDNKYIDIFLESLEGVKILDVGCGDGSLIGFLGDSNKHLIGIDAYEPCIKKAKSQLQSERCDFHCDDFLEHSFDC